MKIKHKILSFINFCYNQGIRNKINNSKLFIENGYFHYHLKSESGFVDNDNSGGVIKEAAQYVVKFLYIEYIKMKKKYLNI